MHVGKMMAKMNPKTVRFDIGAGGTPDLTPEMIAAALGMVTAGLGRELLCMIWLDGYASQHLDAAMGSIADLQRDEWMRREQQQMHGLLAVASHTGGESLRRAQRLYADAHAQRWPAWVDDAELGTLSQGYIRVRRGVLAELGAAPEAAARRWYGDELAGAVGRNCTACGGRGSTDRGGLIVMCGACSGSGQQQVSNRSRARMLSLAESSYRETWARVYDWTYAECTDALQYATHDFHAAVG